MKYSSRVEAWVSARVPCLVPASSAAIPGGIKGLRGRRGLMDQMQEAVGEGGSEAVGEDRRGREGFGRERSRGWSSS